LVVLGFGPPSRVSANDVTPRAINTCRPQSHRDCGRHQSAP